MAGKTGQVAILTIPFIILMEFLVVPISAEGAPPPEWQPIPAPSQPLSGHAQSFAGDQGFPRARNVGFGESSADCFRALPNAPLRESVVPSGFWQVEETGRTGILAVSAAFDSRPRAILNDHDPSLMGFETPSIWQPSRALSALTDIESSVIPLPPINDFQPVESASTPNLIIPPAVAPPVSPEAERETHDDVKLPMESVVESRVPGSLAIDPFHEAGMIVGFADEELPPGSLLVAQSDQSDQSELSGESASGELLLPPAPQGAAGSKSAADLLFQKRLGELNRPLHGIHVGFPASPGAYPVSPAASQDQEMIPVLIWAGDGWLEPRPARYTVPFSYQPLYYEEPNLERCGVGYGFLQPLFSSAAFVKNTITLPYHLITQPPRSEVPTPGDCFPSPRFSWNHKSTTP